MTVTVRVLSGRRVLGGAGGQSKPGGLVARVVARPALAVPDMTDPVADHRGGTPAARRAARESRQVKIVRLRVPVEVHDYIKPTTVECMRAYRERLSVPVTWWLLTALCVAIFGTTLWAGLPLAAVIAVFVALAGLAGALLISWGRAVIEVTGTGLRAGGRLLDLTAAGRVEALDAEQTRLMRGPRADPAAFLLLRPYLPKSVYIEIAGRPAGEPYWLIATRHPAGLAAAIERARIGVLTPGAGSERDAIPTSGKDPHAS